MAHRSWSRDELVLAMNLYCQLPFGKLHARNREVISLATALGRTPSSVAMKLCNLASLDPAHQDRGVRGLSKVSAGDRSVWEEFHANWNRLASESELLREKLMGSNGVGEQILTAIPRALPVSEFGGETEAARQVRVRLAQKFFRRAVLSSYEFRCCITGIRMGSLLIASHILPWSQFPGQRADPRNGLCLSRLHDAAFDRGLIAFDDDYRLILSNDLRRELANAVLSSAFREFEGRVIRLPQKFRPARENLRVHRESVFIG